jgi:hypothetical protein
MKLLDYDSAPCRPLLGNGRKQTLLNSNESMRNNRGTVENGVSYGGPCPGVISGAK